MTRGFIWRDLGLTLERNKGSLNEGIREFIGESFGKTGYREGGRLCERKVKRFMKESLKRIEEKGFGI